MENYEKKYKEALEQAKQELEACGSLNCDAARQIFRLFPELQSIKNERIKTNIIKLLRFVRDTHHQYFDECNEAIEWLKKQFDTIICLEDNWIREELIHFLETCQDTRFVGNRKRDKWIEWLKKYPIFNMPKIEFKVGDWVIFKCGTPESVYKVEKLENYEYTLEHFLGGSMPLPFSSQSLLRPWTIQDAKRGDILQADKCTFIFDSITKDIDNQTVISSWCFCDSKKFYGMGTSEPDLWNIEGITPATKEQRDLLFQKMHEAGYIWDSNKKELIKYE